MKLSWHSKLVWVVVGVLVPFGALAEGAPSEKVKNAPCTASLPLDKKNPIMQRELEKALANKGLSKYVSKKLLAVAVVDLSKKGQRFYAGINDDEMMYAASLSKIGILLAVVDAVDRGEKEWSYDFDKNLTAMITESSNEAATWGAEQVGLKAIEKVLRDPKYCLYDDKFGGLWVGRAYGGNNETNLDPLKNISHGATARQAARFFTLLDAGKLVSQHWSFRMLGLMGPPKHHHKFVGALDTRPGVVFLARKSGTWRDYHSDGALIQHFDNRYVAVALSELKKGEEVVREIGQVLDDIVMEGEYRRTKKRPRQASR